MDAWETVFAGSVTRANMYADNYLTLDFLSIAAKQSIVYAAGNVLIHRQYNSTQIPHPDWIPEYTIYIKQALREHGLATIFADTWRDAFIKEFLQAVTKYLWENIYFQNESIDKARERDRHFVDLALKKKADKLAKAKAIIEANS